MREPFLLSPAAKDYLWGGERLNEDFSKNIGLHPLAETWECSIHPDGPSTVVSGEFAGSSLPQVLSEHPEFLGEHYRNGKELPILIKLIDAKSDLSIQVHPDDAYAESHEGGQLGKTELWYVLDATKQASIIYGFKCDVTPSIVRNAIRNGVLEKYLYRVPIQKGDAFLINAGKVHAIGAGALIAEIQENSNLTYRLYDYDRLDKDGKKRPLHIKKALDVADLKSSGELKQPMRIRRFYNGYSTDSLCNCKYFYVEKVFVNTESCRKPRPFTVTENSFEVFLCVDGCGTVFFADKCLMLFKGDCLFVPADSVPFSVHGTAVFLRVRC